MATEQNVDKSSVLGYSTLSVFLTSWLNFFWNKSNFIMYFWYIALKKSDYSKLIVFMTSTISTILFLGFASWNSCWHGANKLAIVLVASKYMKVYNIYQYKSVKKNWFKDRLLLVPYLRGHPVCLETRYRSCAIWERTLKGPTPLLSSFRGHLPKFW